MKQFLRITAAVLAAAFLFALTGCSGGSGAASFTWFVDTIPANLDPQVVSAAPDVIACENLYGGLVRKNADGEIVPNLCESWTVSPDGRTYTFAIKDGLTYTAAKGTATEHSDVDLLVDSGLRGLKFFGLLESVTCALNLPVDLLDVTQIEHGSKVEHEIQNSGVAIYGQ